MGPMKLNTIIQGDCIEELKKDPAPTALENSCTSGGERSGKEVGLFTGIEFY